MSRDRNHLTNPPDADEQRAWVAAAVRELDQSAERLDAASLSRLNRARQAALDVARVRRAPRWFWHVGFAAAVSFALVLVVLPILRAPLAPESAMAIKADDLELLASADGLDLYRDMEFYAWLDTQQPAGG